MARRRRLVALSIATAALVVSLLLVVADAPDVRITASSGSSPSALLTGERGDVS